MDHEHQLDTNLIRPKRVRDRKWHVQPGRAPDVEHSGHGMQVHITHHNLSFQGVVIKVSSLHHIWKSRG